MNTGLGFSVLGRTDASAAERERRSHWWHVSSPISELLETFGNTWEQLGTNTGSWRSKVALLVYSR